MGFPTLSKEIVIMKKYTLNPTLGFRQAYMVLNPQATNDDFLTWLREQDDSEKDPRLMNSAMAVLCEQALSELVERQACVVGSKLVADVAGALSHYETSIRAFYRFDWSLQIRTVVDVGTG